MVCRPSVSIAASIQNHRQLAIVVVNRNKLVYRTRHDENKKSRTLQVLETNNLSPVSFGIRSLQLIQPSGVTGDLPIVHSAPVMLLQTTLPEL